MKICLIEVNYNHEEYLNFRNINFNYGKIPDLDDADFYARHFILCLENELIGCVRMIKITSVTSNEHIFKSLPKTHHKYLIAQLESNSIKHQVELSRLALANEYRGLKMIRHFYHLIHTMMLSEGVDIAYAASANSFAKVHLGYNFKHVEGLHSFLPIHYCHQDSSISSLDVQDAHHPSMHNLSKLYRKWKSNGQFYIEIEPEELGALPRLKKKE